MAADVGANVSTKPLDGDDFTEVLEELKDVQSECLSVGTWLKLKRDTLNGIRKDKLSHAEALEKIVENWLDKNYNHERFGPPTWQTLVRAVAHPSGGHNNRLAGEIAKRHPASGSAAPQSVDSAPLPSTTNSNTSSSSSSSLPPVEVGSIDPNFFQEATSVRVQMDGGGKKPPCDRYDPQPRGTAVEIRFSFGTVKTFGGEKHSVAGSYNMPHWPHGVAVIINNERFQKHRDREGTHIDEKNLVQALRYLGYRVDVYRNINAEAILEVMEEYRKLDHSKFDSFVCCILSHGKMGQIYGSDSLIVSLDEVTSRLSGDRCHSLAAKPKMFFLQACRGTMKDRGVEADDDEAEEAERVFSSASEDGARMATDSDFAIPSAEDFFFSYATASGHVAWRDLDNGSWYVSELCRSLGSYARFASLGDMLTITNKKVSTQYANAGYKQATEVTSRLGSDVFFF